MTQNNEPTVDGFFDNVGGGAGAPSAKLKDVNDFVQGTIESQRIVDYIPFGKTDPEVNKDGSVRKQLVVILQTELRGWQGVSKIPVVDRDVPLNQQVAKDPRRTTADAPSICPSGRTSRAPSLRPSGRPTAASPARSATAAPSA